MSYLLQAKVNALISVFWLGFVIFGPKSDENEWLRLIFSWGSGFVLALAVACLNRHYYWRGP